MSDNLFSMISEKPEVTITHEEYQKALEDLRAQVLTAPEEGMYEEQEMWIPEWQKRLHHLMMSIAADGLKGSRLGVLPEDKPVFIKTHNTCRRWMLEAAKRVEVEKERVAREKEAAEVEA
ncbi:hypothetical protein PAXINDRAFT_19720 [Paxillus involutus ATCC 200175]|uniref:Unplaced genomic scaffold PAXINscaffold_707, whole genome shotgun sequence n=1 Tax=Paxillus involutus ATCC 200175 TaxID=664439 RepID=A0A0C9SN03_PAXIN|nr:hypothetical protein PAXINDRAFT_19720 [Paxillus involutus ATCC 200175]